MASKQSRSKESRKLRASGRSRASSSTSSTVKRFALVWRTAIIGSIAFVVVILMATLFWPLPPENSADDASSISTGEVLQLKAQEQPAELDRARVWLDDVTLPEPQPIEYDSVQRELREAIEDLVALYQDDYKAQHLAGLVYAQLKQSTLAEKAFRNSIASNATDVQIRIDLAKELMQTGRDDEALLVLHPVVERGGKSSEYTLLHAELQTRVGRLDEAIATLAAATKHFHASAKHWLQIGKLRFQAGDYTTAEEDIRKSIELDRGDEQAWLALCQVLAARKASAELGEARKEFELLRAKNAKLSRGFEEVHLQTLRRFAVSSLRSMGLIYFEHQAFEPALRRFRRALKLEPRDLPTLNALAAYYRRLGKLELACETNRAILFIANDDYVNFTNLASLSMECNEVARAEAVLRLASERAVAPERSHLNLAKFLMMVNKPQQAVAPARLAVAADHSAEATTVLAQAIASTNGNAEAGSLQSNQGGF